MSGASASEPPTAVTDSCDVAIVGCGPAGLAAAQVLREQGLAVTLIDEQPRAGGQFLRQPPRGFTVSNWLPGKLYAPAKSVLHAVEGREGIDWRLSSTVLGIMPVSQYRADARGASHELWIQGPSGAYVLRAGAILLATGCYERPLAFPGWTLPGVMGAGAIQGFLKSQQFVPGKRFVLAGSHPLQLVVADQLAGAGADVAAVVFTQPWQRALAVLLRPDVLLRYSRTFLETARIVARLRRARVPMLFGRTIVRAEGTDAVERVTVAALRAEGSIDHGHVQAIECDRLGLCHGFLTSSELARQAGAQVRWCEHEGGWVVDHDEWFESTAARIFVAGEITGVAGADAALEKGRIAAAGILQALGRIDKETARRLAQSARHSLASIAGFAAALRRLAQPPPGLALETLTPETILCRCERVTRGTFEQALRDHPHVQSADAAKLLTRVGMGLCQGRLCGDNAARLIATLRDTDVTEVGPFQVRAPVKPLLLGTIRRERCD
ncbi:MAG: NAD(P)/FAD-dependent oxidoreductase [Gammaproteobacteria bacterium]